MRYLWVLCGRAYRQVCMAHWPVSFASNSPMICIHPIHSCLYFYFYFVFRGRIDEPGTCAECKVEYVSMIHILVFVTDIMVLMSNCREWGRWKSFTIAVCLWTNSWSAYRRPRTRSRKVIIIIWIIILCMQLTRLGIDSHTFLFNLWIDGRVLLIDGRIDWLDM